MFNKNDPLINSVKQVMAENDLRRKVEKQLNEELNITSKKGLPFEYHAEYDALLEQRMKEELVGNQHKIDANKNNRVDAHDFKLLRAGKKAMSEEEGDETREGGAVTKDGKVVVSPTAPKASDGPSQKDREALTNKIKSIMKENTERLEEKAVSKAQQRFFGLVNAIKEKKAHGSAKAEKAAKEMSTKEVKKFAKTKQKGLPEKVDEDFDLEAVLEEIRANIGEEAFDALMEAPTPPMPPRRPQTGPAGTASQPQASNPRGETVTSIKKTGGGDYNVYQKGSQSASEFQQLYGAARKAGAGKFEWQGRQYATGKEGGREKKNADQDAASGKPGAAAQGVLKTTADDDTRAQMSQTPSGRPDYTASPSLNRMKQAGPGNEKPEDIMAADASARTRAAAQTSAATLGPAMRGPMPPPGQRTLAQQLLAGRQEAGTAPKPPDQPPSNTNVPTPPPRPAASTPPERERRQPAVSGSTMAGFPGLDEGKGSYMRESLETTIKKVLKG